MALGVSPRVFSRGYFQLTHDYLVPSLRDWITREDRATRAGRARLLLAERTALWNAKPFNRNLPTVAEHLTIRRHTVAGKRSGPERKLLARAAVVHGTRALLAVAGCLLLTVGGLFLNHRVNQRRDRDQAQSFVTQTITADPTQLPGVIAQLSSDQYRDWARPVLQSRLDQALATDDATAIIPLRLALLESQADASQVEPLRTALLTAKPETFVVIRDLLEKNHKAAILEPLWTAATETEAPAASRFQAACALATYAPTDARWSQLASQVVERLVSLPAAELVPWRKSLEPARKVLQQPLEQLFETSLAGSQARQSAAETLALFAADDGALIAEAMIAADPATFEKLLPVAEQNKPAAIARFEQELAKTLEPQWDDSPLDTAWRSVPATARDRILAADGLIDERFAMCLTLPVGELVELCESLRPSGYRPISLVTWPRGDDVLAAVVWNRDGANWKIAGPIEGKVALDLDAVHQPAGLRPMLVDSVPPAGRQICVLWGPSAEKRADRTNGANEKARLGPATAPTALSATWSLKFFRFEPAEDKTVLPDVAQTKSAEPFFEREFPQLEITLPAEQTAQLQNVIITAETTLTVESGSHQLWAVADDGVRVTLDGKVMIDRWERNDRKPTLVNVALDAGVHTLRVEHFQRDGGLTLAVRLGLPRVELVFGDGEVTSAQPDANLGFEYTSQSTAMAQGLMADVGEQIRRGYRPVRVKDVAGEPGRPMQIQVELRRPALTEDAKDVLASRQSHATVALARLGRSDVVWPRLAFHPDWTQPATQDPRRRTEILHDLATYNVDWGELAARLKEMQHRTNRSDPSDRTDASIRRALLLALGGYSATIAPADRDQVVTDLRLLELYETDPDAGVHGAVESLLRTWNKQADIAEVKLRLSTSKTRPAVPVQPTDRGWFVSPQRQTFTVFAPGEFWMGSPESEPQRESNETRHRRLIERPFALATTEVSREQFLVFVQATGADDKPSQFVKSPDSPQTRFTWFEAARYCNWLSDQEGLARCYKIREVRGGLAVELEEGFLDRNGYRLPTEAEWEYACRAGSATSRYYGLSEIRLEQYAWYLPNSGRLTHAVGVKLPNDAGLFDMLGNANEWCHDAGFGYPRQSGPVPTLTDESANVDVLLRRVLRGGTIGTTSSFVRSSYRIYFAPDNDYDSVSFRPSRTYR